MFQEILPVLLFNVKTICTIYWFFSCGVVSKGKFTCKNFDKTDHDLCHTDHLCNANAFNVKTNLEAPHKKNSSLTYTKEQYISMHISHCPPRLVLYSLLHLEHIDLAGILQCLSAVTKPNSYNLPVIIQFLGNFCDLLPSWKCIFLKIAVQDLNGLWCETGAAFAFFGRLTSHKFHQILLALLVPELRFSKPTL